MILRRTTVLINQEAIKNNFINIEGLFNQKLAEEIEAERRARELDSMAKLDRSSDGGTASWENGTLTIESSDAQKRYAVVIGADGIEFKYNDSVAASINQDRLVIDKTVVLDEMQVGNGKWTWKIDNADDSIYLKWIG